MELEKIKELTPEKGMYFSNDQLAKHFGKPILWNDLLVIRQIIHDNYPFLCKVEGDGIRILDDSEGSVYGPNRTLKSLYCAKRTYKQTMRSVNVKNLNSQERQSFHHNTEILGKTIQAVDDELKRHIPVNIDSYNTVLPKIFK